MEPPIYQAHDLWGSKAIQIIYQAIHSLYSGFIGQYHFKCMNKYLGYHGIALIINQFLQTIQTMVNICVNAPSRNFYFSVCVSRLRLR